MKPFLRLALLAGLAVAATFASTSCQTNHRGGSTDTFTPAPTLSPVDATDRMRSQFRQWR